MTEIARRRVKKCPRCKTRMTVPGDAYCRTCRAAITKVWYNSRRQECLDCGSLNLGYKKIIKAKKTPNKTSKA